MASCPDQKVGRQLILHRGLHPLVLDPPGSPGRQPLDAVDMAKCAGFCQAGDKIIVAYRDYDSPAKDLALKIITVSLEGTKMICLCSASIRFASFPFFFSWVGGPLGFLVQLELLHVIRTSTTYAI